MKPWARTYRRKVTGSCRNMTCRKASSMAAPTNSNLPPIPRIMERTPMLLSKKKAAIAVAALATTATVALWAASSLAQDAAPPAGAPAAAAGDAAAPARAPRAEGAGGGFRTNTSLGVVKAGNVPNYTNVTDEMLKNPSPNDWLMYRGNYAGWSYSKLNQITTDNVGKLQLKWLLAMNEGGTNETTPMIHDGIMYLFSSGNTIQAINA